MADSSAAQRALPSSLPRRVEALLEQRQHCGQFADQGQGSRFLGLAGSESCHFRVDIDLLLAQREYLDPSTSGKGGECESPVLRAPATPLGAPPMRDPHGDIREAAFQRGLRVTLIL